MTVIKENDSAKNEPMPSAAKGVAFDGDEDEIDLMDYCVLLWRHKYLIIAGSILPTLVIGLVLFSSPRDFELTYTYGNWEVDDKKFEMFLDGFYSGENLGRIIPRLKNEGFEKYAVSIGNAGARGRKSLQKLILFEVWPPYMDLSNMKGKGASQMEELRKLTSLLVKMTITARPQSDVAAIASIVRNNVEHVTPLFDIEGELISEINEYRTKMAEIEENRFGLELSLKTKTNILAQLKNMKVEVLDTTETNFTLQFNIGNQSEYLPLAYHIRAAETGIVELKEEVRQYEDEHTHYEELTALNEKLLGGIRNSKSSEYTVGQFHSFVSDLHGRTEKTEVKDDLTAYIKRLENRMLSRVPVTDTPKTHSLGKGTVKKTGTAFVMFLIVSVFATFLREGVRRRHAGTV